jgi:hypothetical protein
MRRVLAVTLSVLAALVFVAPDAFAQAPTSKVTINGLVDTVTSWTRNTSTYDNNLEKNSDEQWYARTRVRPDITGEVGTTKFVLGIEIDHAYGAVGPAGSGTAATQAFGTTSSLNQNTDMAGTLELKWAYTEFDVPGIPFATRMRVGAQPWQATYKGGILATGDFGGVHLSSTLAPPVKLNLTYAQLEEKITGNRDGFTNGEDYAAIVSVELTPFKGFDLRPLFHWFHAEGLAPGQARLGRGGVSNTAGFFPANTVENRFTAGIDSRLRMGPFSIDPTVLYQFGQREMVRFAGASQPIVDQDISALFIDLRAGFQAGPLLIEAAAIYTTGNNATQDLRNPDTDIKYFQVTSADSGFYGTWAEHFALGIDYFQALREGGGTACTCNSIGYDKYGLMRFGARASYAVTPAFSPRIAVTTQWTAKEVDTDAAFAPATGLTQTVGTRQGDHSYLGTEVDLGFTWRFAPGLAMDAVYAYTFAGPAWASATASNNAAGAAAAGTAIRDANNPENVQSAVLRIRYTF